MPHHQLTSFEAALLRAVEDLNATFEAGLKRAGTSPRELENLQNGFERFSIDLEKRLSGLALLHKSWPSALPRRGIFLSGVLDGFSALCEPVAFT